MERLPLCWLLFFSVVKLQSNLKHQTFFFPSIDSLFRKFFIRHYIYPGTPFFFFFFRKTLAVLGEERERERERDRESGARCWVESKAAQGRRIRSGGCQSIGKWTLLLLLTTKNLNHQRPTSQPPWTRSSARGVCGRDLTSSKRNLSRMKCREREREKKREKGKEREVVVAAADFSQRTRRARPQGKASWRSVATTARCAR